MDAQPGTYALILRAAGAARVRVGKLGDLQIPSGSCVYVGSAFGPGGVLARVRHHLRRLRAPHWHIDYLRRFVSVEEVWYAHDVIRREHLWAGVFGSLPGAGLPLRGFGASDCDCAAHLLTFGSPPSLSAFRRALQDRVADHAPIKRWRA